MSIEKQALIYNFLLNAINSDNTDYILEQLSKIYTMIYSNNIDSTEFRHLKESE